jgi:hypothetical protein
VVSDLAVSLITLFVTCWLALFSYLVKSYFKKFDTTFENLKKDIFKLEGSLESLSRDIRNNTIESAGLRSEVNALWRFLDNSYKRTTDGAR